MHAWRPPRAARWPSAPTATASIESILNHRLDEHPPEPIEPAAPIEHHNIRGSDYYS